MGLKKVTVVYCLLYNKETNEVLVVYNGDSSRWSLPGGAVEPGETLEQAVVREVYEETNLSVKVKQIACVNERFFQDKDEHVVFITFIGEIIGGNISINHPEEISEIIWVNIREADRLMPYYQFNINNFIHNSVPYIFQE